VKTSIAWRVCYDITEPRRLARVWRAVREFAVPLQYSVFWTRLNDVGVDVALNAIAAWIDPRRDDVRLYPGVNSDGWLRIDALELVQYQGYRGGQSF
jgi:CRISPR/Cas system-associated endoribonuclease Cas2